MQSVRGDAASLIAGLSRADDFRCVTLVDLIREQVRDDAADHAS